MAGAGIDELLERAVHALQLVDALLDVTEFVHCAVADLGHVLAALITEAQQVADFIEAETQRLGAADETQAGQVRLAEDR